LSEKPFPPSAKKLRDARKKGEFPRSAQIVSTAVFGAVLFAAFLSMPATLKRFKELFQAVDAIFREGITEAVWLQFYAKSLGVLMWTIMPVLAVCIVAAIASGWFQTKGLITLVPLQPKLERLNPVSNIKNLVSIKQMLDLLKKLLETVVLGGLIAWVAWKAIAPMLLSVYQKPMDTATIGAQLVFSMFITATIFWIAVSAIDYGIQYFTFMRDQRMSFEDVKREYKDMEGDPHIKGERQAIHREMAQSAPQRSLHGASALVANPTHVVVAIAFNTKSNRLPTIHAKALDAQAQQMKSQAFQMGIPVFEDVSLARAMHRDLAVGHAITPDFYAPVSRIMVWVEQLNGNMQSDAA
jgi:type III secretion protein U